MNKQRIKAFTLVELIVVITILAILGTIAFISLQWYSKDARDSTRISDMSTMKSALELYNLDAGKYPVPTNWEDITYSGSVVWTQWIFWETVYANLSKLDKIPLDPTTDKEYTYSTTGNKYEYQLWGIMEGDTISMNNSWIDNSFASLETATAYVSGNYNWIMLKSLTWTTCNILALPSIITNNLDYKDIHEIVTQDNLVYTWFKSYPASFSGRILQNLANETAPSEYVAYSDTWSCIALTNPDSSTARVALLSWLQNAYSGTILENVWEIANIVNLDINTSSPSTDVVNYAGIFVNNVLGSKLSAGSTNSSNNIIIATSTWTFSLSQTGVLVWTSVTISDNCTSAPTSYTSSNTSVATVTWTTITTLSAGTTNITPVWWSCSDTSAKVLTVNAPSDSYWSNVVLLMHFDWANLSTNITDEKNKTVTVWWNSKISTTQSKFGWSSAYFDGNNSSFLQLADSSDWAFWSNNVTIETWIYQTARPWSSASLWWQNPGTSSNMRVYILSNWIISYSIASDSTSYNTSTTLPLNTWVHLAYVKNWSNFTLYMNWTSIATNTYSTTLADFAYPWQIWWEESVIPFTWYMDDFRITKWVARYTSNFTPPTEAFPNQ